MKKSYFLFCFLLLCSTLIKAQQASHFRNIRTLELNTVGNQTSAVIFQNKRFLLLYADQTLNAGQKVSLSNQGIYIFTNPAPHYYTASVSITLKNKDLQKLGFRGIYIIPAEFKLDTRLKHPQEEANWCLRANKMTVQLTFLPGVSIEKYKEQLSSISCISVGGNQWQLPLEQLSDLVQMPFILRVEPTTPGLTTDNLPGKTLHGSALMEQSYNGTLTGKGVKVGEWDGGFVGQHIDFGSDKITVDSMIYSDHATHVAGTIKSKGILNPYARGMAPDAKLWSSDFYGDIEAEMDTLIGKEHIHITSNSYGYSPAYDPCGTKGSYDIEAQRTDSVAYKYPFLSHVFAATNSQTQCSGGYRTIGSGFNSAKNIISVGAVDYKGNMSSFSSWGPVLDGRLKPEVCGVGVNVYSTLNKDTYAGGWNGTSMATPGVSGTLAQLYEKYYKLYNSDPEASLFRAILSNTAVDSGNAGPDYKFGFGIINGQSALNVLDSVQWLTDTISQGNLQSYSLNCPTGTSQLKVTVAWTDLPGDPQQSKALVQDIDLYLISPSGDTIRPWVLNPAIPAANATRGIDTLNNIEQVTVNSPLPGNWQYIISGNILPGGTQKFSCTWVSNAPQIKVTYPSGGEQFNAGETQTIRWNSIGAVKPYQLYYSTDSGQTWVTISNSVNNNYFDWTVPNVNSKKVYIKVTDGTLSDSSDMVFTIYSSVTGLTATSCNNAVKLSWNAAGSASKYYIYKLNLLNYSWDLTDSTTATKRFWSDYQVSNGTKYYYTISPVNAAGAIGRKCTSVSVIPSSTNTSLITSTGGTTLLCGDTITLSSVTGSSYLWSNGLTGKSQKITTEGSYSVVTTFDSGCVAYSPLIQIQKGYYITSITDTVCHGDSIQLIAHSPQLYTARFTEIIQNKSGTGAIATYPSWINGNSANADYAEISNLGNDTLDLSLLTFEQWNSSGIISQFTWPAGTVFAPAQLSILHIGNTATNDTSKLFFNTGAADDQSASGDQRGYILRHADGTIYDVVAVNGFSFPSQAGVSSFDWEPSTPMNSMQGRAGVGLNTADYNRSQEWYLAASGTPLTTGTYNNGIKTIPNANISWNYINNTQIGNELKYAQNQSVISWTANLVTSNCQSTDSGTSYEFWPGAVQIQSTGHYICQGTTINLNTSQTGAYTYQWTSGNTGNIILNADTFIQAIPAANSLFQLTQTDTVHGCIYQDSYAVSLYGKSQPNWLTAGKQICAGDSLLISGQSDEQEGWNKWEMEITFDVGGTSLSGSNKVYMHAAITDTAANASIWRQLRGNWGSDDGLGLMDSLGADQWRIKLNLPQYFDVNSDSLFGAISMIFRNADGTVLVNNNGDSGYITLNGVSPSSSWNLINAKYIHQYQIIHQGKIITAANSIYASDSGAYYLTDAAFNCNMDTAAAIIIQWYPESKGGQLLASNYSVCAGDSIQIIHSGHTGRSIWEFYNGNQWSTLSLQDDTIWFTPAVSGLVRSLSTDSCHGTYSDTININVITAPVSGNIILSADSICAGDTIAFGYSTNPANISWNFGGNAVSGPGWKPQGSGYLSLYIDGGMCPSIQDSSLISVFSLPQISALHAGASAFCEGDSVQLYLDSFSNANLQWQFYDSIIAGGFVTFRSLDSLSLYTNGFDTLSYGGTRFRVAAVSAYCGTIYSDTIGIIIYPKNRPGNIQLASDSVCPGNYNQVIYTSLGNAKWYNQNVNHWEFLNNNGQWMSTGSNSDTLDFQVNYNTAVRAIFISGCDTQYIQKNSFVKAHATVGTISASKDTVCVSDSITLTSGGHNGNVTWQLNAGVGYTDIGQGDQLTIAVNQAAFVRARYTFGTCDTLYSSAKMIHLYPQPQSGTISLNTNNVCPGTPIELYNIGYDGILIWETFDSTLMQWSLIGSGDTLKVQPTASALFRASVTKGSCGPVYSTSQLVSILDGPVHGPLVADKSKVCVGKSVQLSAGNNAKGNFIWQEFKKATGSWNNLSGNGLSQVVFPYDSSLYRAIISQNGCTDTTNALWITTLLSPVASISAAGNTILCEGETVTLNASFGIGYRYLWQRDSSLISGAILGSYNTGQAGKYRVIVSLANGCSDTSGNILVTVNPLPPTPFISRTGMLLDAGISGYTYQWYNNNIPLAGETGQTYLMTKGGNYTVKVSNAFGCYMISDPYSNSGITGLINENTISIYPNPGTGIFYFTGKVQQCRVYDMAGRLIPVTLGIDSKSFDISSFAPGMYQVVIQEGAKTTSFKIVKYDR